MGLLSFLGDVVGAVTGIGGKTSGADASTKANAAAVAQYKDASTQGANVLSQGYADAQKAKLDALAKIGAITPEQLQSNYSLIDQGYNDYVDQLIQSGEAYAGTMQDGGASYRSALTGAGEGYGMSMDQVVQQFGSQIVDLANKLGVDFETAANVYKQGLDQNAGQYSGKLTGNATTEASGLTTAGTDYGTTRAGGLDAVTSALHPYVAGSGTQSLDYLSTLVNQDPSKLTPQQQLDREKFLRDSDARLAASSLRGAGRAGVAAVNQGDAVLNAQFYDSNQARSIAAANQLAQMGYSASGQVGAAGERSAIDTGNVKLAQANKGLSDIKSAADTGAAYTAGANATGLAAINSAQNQGAVARQTAGNTAASAALQSGQDVAKTQLNLSTDAAKNDQDVAQKVAGVGLNIGQSVANRGDKANADATNATNTAYGQAAGIAAKVGDVNADAALGSASAQAGGIVDPAAAAAQATINNGAIKSQTIGDVASSVGDLAKTFFSSQKSTAA